MTKSVSWVFQFRPNFVPPSESTVFIQTYQNIGTTIQPYNYLESVQPLFCLYVCQSALQFLCMLSGLFCLSVYFTVNLPIYGIWICMFFCLSNSDFCYFVYVACLYIGWSICVIDVCLYVCLFPSETSAGIIFINCLSVIMIVRLYVLSSVW